MFVNAAYVPTMGTYHRYKVTRDVFFTYKDFFTYKRLFLYILHHACTCTCTIYLVRGSLTTYQESVRERRTSPT